MKRLLPRLPLLLTLAIAFAMLIHGPIAQLPHYHEFADSRSWHGLPNAADVLSNVGFALVGIWGLVRLWPLRRRPELAAGWPGYALFLAALVLTAFGSSYYHLAPDDARLVWDRLPIALACAGLLAAVRAETDSGTDARAWTLGLSATAVASVGWWHFTGLHGQGDLRPYLLLQGLPLLLIPLWQAIHGAPRQDRIAFGMALALYALAKITELYDHQILATLGSLSGHTLKHLLATAAALVLTLRLIRRVDEKTGRTGL
ncbi:MAG: alkaline phytoceramidase [Parasulfuritortus sp.]|nr:alkaline phytoceramidase [Parasulfuritortus sp.]